MAKKRDIIPIYTSRGDVGAYLVYPFLFNDSGEWIGWITDNRQVYSVQGRYVGWLSKDPRVLRHISTTFDQPRLRPPKAPRNIRPPATSPLAPLMSELTMGTIDVLEEKPDLLPPVDFGDLREDMD